MNFVVVNYTRGGSELEEELQPHEPNKQDENQTETRFGMGRSYLSDGFRTGIIFNIGIPRYFEVVVMKNRRSTLKYQVTWLYKTSPVNLSRMLF